MTNHRAQAEQWLEGAEEWAASEHRDTTEAQTKAHTAALIAIGHALLAGPANMCRSCGTERQLPHEDWCIFSTPHDPSSENAAT